MEEIASLWNYEELQARDELKQRLLYTSLELEQLRIEACEETRKSSEYVKQLIHLVKIACRERDEARDQLQKLMFMNGKPLPEKGKFLQAVLEAPPLLQTLIVAAPLPRWRNPPQLKPFHIPPVSIRAVNEAEISGPYFEMSSNTMLNNNNVGNFPSATLLGSQMMISAGNYGHPGKRQRFL
nr:uncharacterized protein LOC109193181 [Ipomoea batatas]